jgi:hypothetical protein
VKYSKNWQGDKNSSRKRGSSVISDGEVADRSYEKHEYHVLSSEQKNNLCVKCVKHSRVVNAQGGGGHGGKGGGKNNHAATLESMQITIATLGAKFDKLNIPDDDYDNLSYEEEGTGASNHSNKTLTFHSKKKGERS